MRRAIPFLLLIALAYQCLVSMGVFVWFQSNRSYIAEVWCENKTKPDMYCYGQCVLTKKLKALEENTTDKNTPRSAKSEIFVCVIQDLFYLPCEFAMDIVDHHVNAHQNGYSFIHCANNFRPPKILT